jgi:hypothetical protein
MEYYSDSNGIKLMEAMITDYDCDYYRYYYYHHYIYELWPLYVS